MAYPCGKIKIRSYTHTILYIYISKWMKDLNVKSKNFVRNRVMVPEKANRKDKPQEKANKFEHIETIENFHARKDTDEILHQMGFFPWSWNC